MHPSTMVVVDDEEVDRYLIGRLIRDLKTDVKLIEFEDAEKFVSALQDRARRNQLLGSPPPPLLVLLDINMPRLSGIEALELIAKDPDVTSELVSIVMYTSSSHAGDKSSAMNYDFVKGYLVKPIEKEQLQQVLETYHA